jgi:hypothetical protein
MVRYEIVELVKDTMKGRRRRRPSVGQGPHVVAISIFVCALGEGDVLVASRCTIFDKSTINLSQS